MATVISQRQPITAWQTGLLRLTTFFVPGSNVQNMKTDWWKNLLGREPDSRNEQPKIGQKSEVGQFEKGKLVLAVNPDRVDWLYTVKDDEKPGEIPAIGLFTDALEKFHELMSKWLGSDDCLPVQRLAFGAVLFLPVKDESDGYKQLSVYLPFALDSENTSDFLYRINRLRDSISGIPDLRINRLSTWSVACFQWIESRIVFGLVPSVSSPIPSAFCCKLDLDINTVLDFKQELPREKLLDVFEELINLGKEIIQNGDIK